MSVRVIHGDCRTVLPTLAVESVHSVVTDPPYHLTSIVKRFGKEGSAPAQFGKDGAFARASRGFMGKTWDGGDVAFQPETWRLVLNVLKPGGFLVAFGGTRTFHRMVCAIEDAGFEIRDTIMWLFGSGFPKSLDVSKQLDRMAGADREVVGERRRNGGPSGLTADKGWNDGPMADDDCIVNITAPATDAAREWAGWGTALKPAAELICLARKPLSESSVAANLLKHRCGALNIDANRVPCDWNTERGETWLKSGNNSAAAQSEYYMGRNGSSSGSVADRVSSLGRWPANVLHDGSEEVLAAFPYAMGNFAPHGGTQPSEQIKNCYGKRPRVRSEQIVDGGGSAARFFYTAKADSGDRAGSKHPTVKPTDLMRYLVRLVTPPGGTVLDPFAGTGSTGLAADQLGFNAVLIESDATYAEDARRKISSDAPLFAEVAAE